MIEIKPYKHNKLTSDAFEITGINKSPSVASFISNKVVAHLFKIEDERSETEQELLIKYLSDTSNDAFLAKKNASINYREFIARASVSLSGIVSDIQFAAEEEFLGVLEQASAILFISISELSDRKNQLAYVISKLNENMEKDIFI